MTTETDDGAQGLITHAQARDIIRIAWEGAFAGPRFEKMLRYIDQQEAAESELAEAKAQLERAKGLYAMGLKSIESELAAALLLAEERLTDRNQLQADIEADQVGRMGLRKRHGAREDETFGAFVERLASELAAERARVVELAKLVAAPFSERDYDGGKVTRLAQEILRSSRQPSPPPLLPIDPKDERIVDELMAKRAASLPSTRLYGGKAMPVEAGAAEGEQRWWHSANGHVFRSAKYGIFSHTNCDKCGEPFGARLTRSCLPAEQEAAADIVIKAAEESLARGEKAEPASHWSDCVDCNRDGGYCSKHPAQPPAPMVEPASPVLPTLEWEQRKHFFGEDDLLQLARDANDGSRTEESIEHILTWLRRARRLVTPLLVAHEEREGR
jgi:hypothetical protein